MKQMVKRMAIGCMFVAALALPGMASATLSQTDFKNASKFCKALKADMGASLFKQTYGTNSNRSNAQGKCVSKSAHTLDQVHASAVKSCKAERAADPAAFAQKYGTGKKGANALGKCVSAQEKAQKDAKQQALTNAAQTCRDERTSIGSDAFRTKYGTNHNGRNAFGRCVSKQAKSKTS
jgi:hypothetical protein